jgi:hypothetical protein
MLRGVLPTGRVCRWARIVLTLVHLGIAGWLGWLVASCIWPYRCGEGFAAGYAAGAVGLFSAIWALLWLIGEGLMLLCVDLPATPGAET